MQNCDRMMPISCQEVGGIMDFLRRKGKMKTLPFYVECDNKTDSLTMVIQSMQQR